jgi:NADPH:quinone reductase-like Zn-dependent oxidoreductase
MLIRSSDGGATLEMGEVDPPTLGPTDVRLRVRAASVNRADLLARAGRYPAAGGAIAGMDAAGDVLAVGADVHGFAPGDRVMAMVSGGLAEEVVLPAAMAIPIPRAWSYVEGAAAVLGLMTEHNALATAGRMARGETVLVHAVTAGVGTQAVQVARCLGAGRIFGTSRSAAKAGAVEKLGLDELIDTSEQDFAERVLDATDGAGVDVIVDHVGGPYLAQNIRAAAIRGRIVGVGRLGGAEGVLDMEELARKRIELIGVTFRTRTPAEKADVVAALRAGIDIDGAADALRPIVDRTLDWTRALEAQTELGRNAHVGKIVLQVEG